MTNDHFLKVVSGEDQLSTWKIVSKKLLKQNAVRNDLKSFIPHAFTVFNISYTKHFKISSGTSAFHNLEYISIFIHKHQDPYHNLLVLVWRLNDRIQGQVSLASLNQVRINGLALSSCPFMNVSLSEFQGLLPNSIAEKCKYCTLPKSLQGKLPVFPILGKM